ncbi:MAG: hypothetical protein ACE5K0_05635 [Candidatus Methanofastidiosia archaeon]
MVKWRKMVIFKREERILINPLDPVYKELLSEDYDEEYVVREVRGRLSTSIKEESFSEDVLYNPPQREVFVATFPLVAVSKLGSHSPEAQAVCECISKVVEKRLRFALENTHIEEKVLDAMSEIAKVKLLSKTSERFERESEYALYKKKMVEIEIPTEDIFRVISYFPFGSVRIEDLRYLIRWNVLSDILKYQNLTDLYLVDGWTPVTRVLLIDLYTKLLKENLKNYIDEKRLEYRSRKVKLPKIFGDIFYEITKLVPRSRILTSQGPKRLFEEKFPPCIQIASRGVGSGLRNYAITVLLTSFLSYARVYPSFRIFDPTRRLKLSQERISILLREVIPKIIQAGERCDPPLFKDQPLEKANIFYHLGFGLTENPTPRDFGTSKWYLPPSCEKIRQNAPPLCQPDEFCLANFYSVTDYEKFSQLIKSAEERGSGSANFLKAILRLKVPREISKVTGLSEDEVSRLLENLKKSKILKMQRIRNPFQYYLRRRR